MGPLLLGTILFLVLMAGLFVPLEGWFPRRAGRMTGRAVLSCVALLFVDVFAMGLVGGALLETLAALSQRARASLWPAADASPLLRGLAVFVLAELLGYWTHRMMHRVPWLWRFHEVHHAPTHVTWLEAWRQHPVDFVIHGVIVGLPGALLGASLSEFTAIVLLRKTYTTFLHANVSWRLAWLETVIATPAFHRVHHSQDPREYDRNFAGMFPVIDTIFGTRAGSLERSLERSL